MDYTHFKEAGTELPYSPDHQINDIRAIKQVIETNNSLLVLGLSGSGKSSVLRFLVANPAVQSDDMFFTYVDCNGLDWNTTEEIIQEEICIQLIERLVTLNPQVSKGERIKDNLRLLMKELNKNGPKHLIVIFDRSELLQSNLGEVFFDYLRALRDINPHLSYVFGGRYLNPSMFGELTDILWDEPHWIGALSTDDAKWTITRHLTRLKMSLKEEESNKLLICVGHHPGLLKYACELVKAKKVDLNDSEPEVIDQILTTFSIQNQCQNLWQELSLEAQNILRQVAQNKKTTTSLPAVKWLIRCGILRKSKNNDFEFVSPVFRRYVQFLGPPPLSVEQGMVFKGTEAINLSREEFELFWILWQKKPNVVSQDLISDAIWPKEQGAVTPQMITNLIKRLRDKLGDKHYIENVRGRGYQFIQGTAPLPRSDIYTSTRRT